MEVKLKYACLKLKDACLSLKVTQAANAAIGVGAAGLAIIGILALARSIGRENRNKE